MAVHISLQKKIEAAVQKSQRSNEGKLKLDAVLSEVHKGVSADGVARKLLSLLKEWQSDSLCYLSDKRLMNYFMLQLANNDFLQSIEGRELLAEMLFILLKAEVLILTDVISPFVHNVVDQGTGDTLFYLAVKRKSYNNVLYFLCAGYGKESAVFFDLLKSDKTLFCIKMLCDQLKACLDEIEPVSQVEFFDSVYCKFHPKDIFNYIEGLPLRNERQLRKKIDALILLLTVSAKRGNKDIFERTLYELRCLYTDQELIKVVAYDNATIPMLAVRVKSIDAVKLLFFNGANPSLFDDDGHDLCDYLLTLKDSEEKLQLAAVIAVWKVVYSVRQGTNFWRAEGFLGRVIYSEKVLDFIRKYLLEAGLSQPELSSVQECIDTHVERVSQLQAIHAFLVFHNIDPSKEFVSLQMKNLDGSEETEAKPDSPLRTCSMFNNDDGIELVSINDEFEKGTLEHSSGSDCT